MNWGKKKNGQSYQKTKTLPNSKRIVIPTKNDPFIDYLTNTRYQLDSRSLQSARHQIDSDINNNVPPLDAKERRGQFLTKYDGHKAPHHRK